MDKFWNQTLIKKISAFFTQINYNFVFRAFLLHSLHLPFLTFAHAVSTSPNTALLLWLPPIISHILIINVQFQSIIYSSVLKGLIEEFYAVFIWFQSFMSSPLHSFSSFLWWLILWKENFISRFALSVCSSLHQPLSVPHSSFMWSPNLILSHNVVGVGNGSFAASHFVPFTDFILQLLQEDLSLWFHIWNIFVACMFYGKSSHITGSIYFKRMDSSMFMS